MIQLIIEAVNTPLTGALSFAILILLWIRENINKRIHPPTDQNWIDGFEKALSLHCARSQAEYDSTHK